ncbi:6547_t:CDS:2 [Acaulospora morrowiae]|uniref:6547_t:CDS:1 n=1 Tax=Acaulospora morrowiae TaxID=94023 RepID=A0A9N9D097_9GLOM|nr:6547_t:CDS:2 [Acaulospora morrowiae]
METGDSRQNETESVSSVFRINFPTSIFRTGILMPPVHQPSVTQDKTGGLFNNNDIMHVLKDDTRPNVYTHRLSYNVLRDSYYENGNLGKEYIKKWKKGVLSWNNIYYKWEFDWDMVYLARDPYERRKDIPGEIRWKFDYRPGKFVISKLSLKLQHTIFDDNASIVWTITALPTRANVNTTPQTIEFEPASSYPHNVNSRKDVTLLVEGQYGFVLCASLSGGLETNISWQRTQLFRRSTVVEFDEFNPVDDDSGINFGLDVKVELTPDLICESLPEAEYGKEKANELVLDDKETSDFVIHLEIPEDSVKNDDSLNKEIRNFYVHCSVLSARSDYFKALLNSQMIEAREKVVTLSGILPSSFETILKFIYTGTLSDVNSLGEWVELLHGASRLLIPALVQRCEQGIRGYLNEETVETIEAFAEECGATQLLRCCKMLNVGEE